MRSTSKKHDKFIFKFSITMRLLIVSSHYEGDEILDQDSNKYGNQFSVEL